MDEFFENYLTILRNMLFNPVIQSFLAPFFAFFVGGLAGLVSFANDFTDKPTVILKSWPCHIYAVYSGVLAVLAFQIIDILGFKILSLSISDHPYILAILVGGAGYALVTSSLQNQNEADHKFSIILQILFQKIHTLLYHQYGIIQNTKLRPEVNLIMHDVDDKNVWEFSRKCIVLAKGINEEKGNALGESYKIYKESSREPGAHKIEIGMDLAKIIGLGLLKQVAEEMKNIPSIDTDIKSLDAILAKMQAMRPKE